ncbi:aspartyl protease AED1-like [Solanum dulcamara]|uniref:aspartyl protease AED1-like n=1 Tax=Solanum dulcamara TaxID=45834 RepID=UPI0024857E8E|nr:aspartyl protease AED1-like [Solanum dulcamara]
MEQLLLTLILMSMLHLNSLASLINEKSYFKVNYTALKQARKAFMAFDTSNLQDPPMPPKSFSVYHLDLFEKSKFKDYDSVFNNRLAQDHVRATYLSSRLRSHGSTKNKKGIDSRGRFYARNSSKILDQILKVAPTMYMKGHYVATFRLGSEKIHNLLLIDSANYLTWWQCAPCIQDKCFKPQFYSIYDHTTSNTFRELDCVEESATCISSDPDFHCSLGSKACFYVHVYDNGETTKGFVASEIITFPSDNTQARINFGCSIDQKSGTDFSGTFSGIVGLSKRVSTKTTGGYSLPSQLGSSLFALCLPSLTSTQPSFLTFNKAPWIYGTEAKLLKNKLNPHFYYVNLYKIFINDKEVPVDPSWWSGKKEDHGVMIDTGSLITRFPHDLYIVFRYIFREQVQYPMLQYPIGIFDTCYKDIEGNEEMYFPIIRFYFGNVSHRQELMLIQERVVANLQGFYCLAFLPWNDKTTLVGSHQLQGTGLTFDMKNNALTFSVDACD